MTTQNTAPQALNSELKFWIKETIRHSELSVAAMQGVICHEFEVSEAIGNNLANAAEIHSARRAECQAKVEQLRAALA